ncbi:MAG: hypothetical protein ABIG39_01420 [Candidatus Micrarchaeota archaeon]
MAEKAVAARVYDVLDEDMYIRKAIQIGIANISAIAEHIRSEHIPDASTEAVRAALRRYASETADDVSGNALGKVLENTEFSLRSNVSVVQVFHERSLFPRLQEALKNVGGNISFVSSSQAVTIITRDESLPGLIKTLGRNNIIECRKGLHAIHLLSGKEIKTTPGFVAFITGLFLRKGINIIEFYSCYKDTVLIVSREDSLRVYSLLDKVLGNRNG